MDGGRISLYFYVIILSVDTIPWGTEIHLGVKNVGICKMFAYKDVCIAQSKNYCTYSECLEVISGDFNSVKTFWRNPENAQRICTFIMHQW